MSQTWGHWGNNNAGKGKVSRTEHKSEDEKMKIYYAERVRGQIRNETHSARVKVTTEIYGNCTETDSSIKLTPQTQTQSIRGAVSDVLLVAFNMSQNTETKKERRGSFSSRKKGCGSWSQRARNTKPYQFTFVSAAVPPQTKMYSFGVLHCIFHVATEELEAIKWAKIWWASTILDSAVWSLSLRSALSRRFAGALCRFTSLPYTNQLIVMINYINESCLFHKQYSSLNTDTILEAVSFTNYKIFILIGNEFMTHSWLSDPDLLRLPVHSLCIRTAKAPRLNPRVTGHQLLTNVIFTPGSRYLDSCSKWYEHFADVLLLSPCIC